MSNSINETPGQGTSKRHNFAASSNSRHGSSLIQRKPAFDQVSNNGSIGSGRRSITPQLATPLGTGERIVKSLRLSKVLTLPEGTTVLDACRRMAIRRVDAALLTDSNAVLCGIITNKDVATRVIAEGLKPEETIVSKIMTGSPAFVMSNTLAVEALQKMVQGRFRHLPVVENGEVIGLLDIAKCLYDAIAGLERAAEKGNAIAAAVEGVERRFGSSISSSSGFIDMIREKMFRPSLGSIIHDGSKLASISPFDTVHTAAKMMKELHVSAVIVTNNKKPGGILTSRDIMTRVVIQNLVPDQTTAEKVMTTIPECVTVDTTILDALHMMHDGKFLHLPVLDQDGYVVACLDVLQLSHVAIALLGNKGSTDMENMVMQKFWDSAFSFYPPDEDNETHSDASASKNGGGSDRVKSQSSREEASFTFKVEDDKGHLHRLSCGFESLAELISVIRKRLGEVMDQEKICGILYEDEEGDRVILATDHDLIAAVNQAKLSGLKALRLYLDYQTLIPGVSLDEASSKPTSNNYNFKIGDTNWPSAYIIAIASVTVVIGLSVVVYIKRSKAK